MAIGWTLLQWRLGNLLQIPGQAHPKQNAIVMRQIVRQLEAWTVAACPILKLPAVPRTGQFARRTDFAFRQWPTPMRTDRRSRLHRLTFGFRLCCLPPEDDLLIGNRLDQRLARLERGAEIGNIPLPGMRQH